MRTPKKEILNMDEQFEYYDDDGTRINPALIPKPSRCVTCRKDDDPEEDVVCLLTRMDQMGEREFVCDGYEEKKG
jgi:hypothetical protein